MPSIYQEIIIRLLLSALSGGLIGLERQYHHKPAGFRTMIMISIGSCMFSILSGLITHPVEGSRIVANVVTGIGFLGAGVIFRSANRVNGITTAAAIWAVAAVGMSIGLGEYFMALIATLLILAVLSILPYVEKRMEKKHLHREYIISFHQEEKKKSRCQELLLAHHLKFNIIRENLSPSEAKITLEVWGKPEDHDSFIASLLEDMSFSIIDYT